MRLAILGPLTACLLACFAPVSAARDFRTWYPEYGSVFRDILESTCSTEYSTWTEGNRATADYANGTATTGESVVQCLLSSTSEFMKTNMASAAVLLGIMPFALSVLGSSSEESALLYVISRRPLLTTLLLAGAPVVVALRPFEFKDPVGILKSREDRFYSLRMGPPWFILLLEYLIALASVANIVHVTYELGVGVITMILPDSSYLPGLWAGTGIIVHIIGALCLRSRLHRLTPQRESILRSEFTLSSHKNITIETVPETKLFLVLSWITSVSTTFHVIFGTLAFSSMQFISVKDAFGVIGRYTASVTLCRVVVMYELSGLRSSVESISEFTPEEGGEKVNGQGKISRIFTFQY
ncbi:hypothetical protein B0T16DRAFT_326696 [Cercophora newfieldiana]|uniref:Uncharacterized protein n=1 Tax=Cercophora newfieldiana TaxID=92897 RepID=A0AA39YED4_9PEZI|nr:hypothetical protein B0T16DRAFT_326696 [Cercophora newfieldiana]